MMLRMVPPSGVRLEVADLVSGLSGMIGGQRCIKSFMADICRYFRVSYCFPVSSGRGALSLVLQAFRRLRPEKDVVAVPAFTSFSVPSAVVNAGLKVALYDLAPGNLNPDIASLEESITERTLCVVVCHLYGYPCAMQAVVAMARRKNIFVIDDAAQAMGARDGEQFAGTCGDAGIFSLSRGKNICTVDGGIILTNSKGIAEILESSVFTTTNPGTAGLAAKAAVLSLLLKPHLYGIPARLPFMRIGASIYDPQFPIQKFTPFQAQMGRRMLAKLEGITAARRITAAHLIKRLDGCITFFEADDDHEPVYLRLPFMCKSEASSGTLPEHGVVPSYPSSLDRIAELKPFLVNHGPFPIADQLARCVLTMPTHEYVCNSDVDTIVERFAGECCH